jgi:hypothetical protein
MKRFLIWFLPGLLAGILIVPGSGTGAAKNFLSAVPNLQIVALGDTFKDRIDQCNDAILKQAGQAVTEDKCFVGFDAFEKVLAENIDIVILATSPFFRPEHLKASVAARKHIFAEKLHRDHQNANVIDNLRYCCYIVEPTVPKREKNVLFRHIWNSGIKDEQGKIDS